MADFFKRFGFAAVVTLAVIAMGVLVAGKALLGGDEGNGAAAPQASGGPPKGSAGKGKGGMEAPAVTVAAVAPQTFYDVVQAIGTAQARESIVVSAKVTDVIRTIRFESGDRVARGQVLVELSSIEQFADLEEARASREAAQRDYERFRDLGLKGFAPAAKVEQARAAFEQADARVRAGQSRIGDRTIRAPFAGVMGLRSASPGALVRPGDPIGTLDDVSSIKLDFDVAESQISQARVGAEIVATTAAQPGRSFAGKVADVDTRVNTQSRTLRVRAIIPNQDGALKPGMLMSVELRSNPRRALAAPEIAVTERSDGSYVFMVAEREGKPVAMPMLVRTGQRSGGIVEIVSGVPEGARIVVDGVQRARPGQPVRIVAPDPPPSQSAPAAGSGVPREKARPTAADAPALRGRSAPAAQSGSGASASQ
jgi:membrane fusion protein (multidrug efflux system)